MDLRTSPRKKMGELQVALGTPVPPHTAHAISVSLPEWRDIVGYREGEKRVMDCMVSGYPRIFIHLSVRKLSSILAQKYAVGNEECMLFPTHRIAAHCRSFIERRSSILGACMNARLVHWHLLSPDDAQCIPKTDTSSIGGSSVDLHIVLFPPEGLAIAKEFWQYTGLGISSRLAEKCLSLLAEPTSPEVSLSPKALHSAASSAKRVLRSRVAGVVVGDDATFSTPPIGQQALVVEPSTRGISGVDADDVYIFPTGMAAIWNAHNISLSIFPAAKTVCFGFPYSDTLKILKKWGPGCHFFGHNLDSDINELATILETESKLNPSMPPILALFTEFPSNPLLRSANLPRLRALADKYDFLIVIDKTIGNFVNVDVLPYADIVVSSLSKIFSGAANVMGGSLTLNPRGRHYQELKAYLNNNFEDLYFNEDAICMERNSRDFKHRIRLIDANAEAVCDFLRSRSRSGGAPSSPIKEVFYPKYITPENYEICRIKEVNPEDGRAGGFGGLFSLTFTSLGASQAFYDALSCYKGPSLGTNFTLACPFTLLAHFAELDWAAQYGVEEGLVRVSVGMEDKNSLITCFEKALQAAEVAASQP